MIINRITVRMKSSYPANSEQISNRKYVLTFSLKHSLLSSSTSTASGVSSCFSSDSSPSRSRRLRSL